MTHVEHSNPVVDGHGDVMIDQFDNLVFDNSFRELLDTQAQLVTTTLNTNKPFAVDAAQLPPNLTEAHHFPTRFTVDNLRLQLTTQPRSGLWALNGDYKTNGTLYSIDAGENGMTLQTTNYEGGTLTMQAPPEVCYQFLSSFGVSPTSQRNVHEMLAYSPDGLSPKVLRTMLEDIGNRFGSVTTLTEANFESIDAIGSRHLGSRVAQISLSDHDSTSRSAKFLRIAVGSDFGAGLTETIVEQSIVAEPEKRTVKYYRGPSDIPIESYIAESQIFGTMAQPEVIQDIDRKRRFATFILTSIQMMSDAYGQTGAEDF